MLLCNIGVIKSITWIKKKLRQTISRINGPTIKQYSTTFLLVGSMASTAHLYAAEAVYHANQNYDAIKQSMMAEFAIAALVGDVFERSGLSQSETCGNVRFFVGQTIKRIILGGVFCDFGHHSGETAHNFDQMKNAFSHSHNVPLLICLYFLLPFSMMILPFLTYLREVLLGVIVICSMPVADEQ